jgi:hypothetical protein
MISLIIDVRMLELQGVVRSLSNDIHKAIFPGLTTDNSVYQRSKRTSSESILRSFSFGWSAG